MSQSQSYNQFAPNNFVPNIPALAIQRSLVMCSSLMNSMFQKQVVLPTVKILQSLSIFIVVDNRYNSMVTHRQFIFFKRVSWVPRSFSVFQYTKKWAFPGLWPVVAICNTTTQ